MVESGLVGTPTRQRIVDVCHRDDPSAQWNLGAVQPVGVAPTIESLVMSEGDVFGHGQVADFGKLAHRGQQRLGSDGRVGLHDLELFFRQASRLEEHAVRNTDLSDIVERARLIERIDELIGDFQELPP